MTFGDDMVASTDGLIDFSHTDIANELGKLGVVFTMPDKTSASKAYVSLKEIDFLKRRFVTIYDYTFAPLSIESIVKSLTVFVASSSVSVFDQMFGVVQSALTELVHHGPRTFYAFYYYLKHLWVDVVKYSDTFPFTNYTTRILMNPFLSDEQKDNLLGDEEILSSMLCDDIEQIHDQLYAVLELHDVPHRRQGEVEAKTP
jgi:hypothetical protein